MLICARAWSKLHIELPGFFRTVESAVGRARRLRASHVRYTTDRDSYLLDTSSDICSVGFCVSLLLLFASSSSVTSSPFCVYFTPHASS